MNFFETIGLNIFDILQEKGIKQTDLADKIGVSKQVMSKIINGQKAINALETKKIADALNVDINKLMEQRMPDTDDDSLIMLMGTVSNPEAKETLKFLNDVIDELIFMEDLLYE